MFISYLNDGLNKNWIIERKCIRKVTYWTRDLKMRLRFYILLFLLNRYIIPENNANVLFVPFTIMILQWEHISVTFINFFLQIWLILTLTIIGLWFWLEFQQITWIELDLACESTPHTYTSVFDMHFLKTFEARATSWLQKKPRFSFSVKRLQTVHLKKRIRNPFHNELIRRILNPTGSLN